MSHILTVDVETYSEVELSSCGLYRYMDDPSFEVLLIGYALDDASVEVLDLTNPAGRERLTQLLPLLRDPDILKLAHNCAFEREALRRLTGEYQPPEQWLDTMVLSAVCGLPMALDQVGKALGFGSDFQKDAAGKALIKLFSCPRKPTKSNPAKRVYPADAPEKWQQYIEYNRQDVVSEREIYRLLKRWAPDGREHRLWCIDARMNEHGVRIDRTLAEQAVRLGDMEREELTERAVALTGMDNPNSVAQVKDWLREQEGLEVATLNKKAIGDVYASLRGDTAREFLDLRAALSKSSVKKYDGMLRCICSDDHARGCFQFYGAGRTGRFSGRLIQFQNLPQNHMDDLDVARRLVRAGDYETVRALYDNTAGTLSELIRTALIAEPGHTLVIADYSAIEARVLAWIAGEEWRLETFRQGGDIYCASASQMFKVPVVKHGINGELRQKGKIAELALGYGGGVGALKAFGADKLGMSEEEMGETVAKWREASPHVCGLWRDLERAAGLCAARRKPTQARCGVRFDYEERILWMTLPSGRRIAYWQAEYTESPRKNGKTLSYMGRNQVTGKWERIETWGGKLTENCWAEGTPVLTSEGWTPIERVTPDMGVWDGAEWVYGVKGTHTKDTEVLWRIDGLLATPNHKILTEKGWTTVENSNGLHRLRVQLPQDYRAGHDEGRAWASEMESPMQELRGGEGNRHPEYEDSRESQPAHILRMPEVKVYRREEEDPRGPRHNRMRQMAAQLREFLGRHGCKLCAGAGLGSKGQQQRLQPGELSVGSEKNELPKQKEQPDIRRKDGSPDIRGERRELHDGAVSYGPRLPSGKADGSTGHPQSVYDIINCGPRHRYVVLGRSGPIYSHNCIQATARDCLREALIDLEDEGWTPIATVHDEIICTEPSGGRTWRDLAAVMSRIHPWEEGLPLNADGYETPYYKKD